jgi:PhnB protein
MPELDAYLFFDGNCAEAMRFYEKTLGGKLESLMTHGEAPPGAAPPGNDDRIMHASLVLDGRRLMASDAMAGQPYERMQGISLSLTYPDAAEGRRIFDALADGGKVIMPYGETFWTKGFGMLVDRFGTPWMVNVASS